MADHIEALKRQGIIVPADDAGGEDEPELPDEVAYLWDWFTELHQSRTGNGFGPNAISYAEIAAWAQVCDTRLEPWEARAIRAVDDAYLMAAQEKKPAGG